MLWAIWILTGAAIGALSGEIMKGGTVDRVGRLIICTLGAIVVGWLLAFVQFMPGGLYIGAVAGAAIGAVLALVGRFIYDVM